VLQDPHLLVHGRVDAGVGVAEEIYPPGTDPIEQARTVGLDKPGTLATRQGDEGKLLVHLHLRAGMPHGAQTARLQTLIPLFTHRNHPEWIELALASRDASLMEVYLPGSETP
jgi:hypothetical protein